MSNHRTQVGINLMEADSCTSQSSSADHGDETDAKLREVDTTTPSDLPSSTRGESSVQHENPDSVKLEFAEEDLAAKLRRKIYEAGLGNVRVPEVHSMSGCSDCEETESDEDDDICSDSDEDSGESGYNPMASGVMPPVLPDIQLRVPMEDENEVQRVKNALLIKGVLEVSCDSERQIVTVTGIVPPSRLLKKVRRVNCQAQVISTVSPFAMFINPHFRASAVADEEFETRQSSLAIDIPSPHRIPNFVVHQQRPRPAFQRYTFHNDPHSPYLRTFSPTDLSPGDTCAFADDAMTGDAHDHHRQNGSALFDDDLFQDIGIMSS